MATATSIRSRLGKLEKQATPYRRMLIETEIGERLLARTAHWSKADFMAICAEVADGGLSREAMLRIEHECF